jgi:hypothetical protein
MNNNNFNSNAVVLNAVDKVSKADSTEGLSLESLAFLVHAERLNHLEDKITDAFIELKQRQDEVSFLHKLIKTINMATVDDSFDCTNNEDLKQLLNKAKDQGIEIVDGKYKYSKDERERLIDNIKITVDDKNVLNDMDLQKITRLTTERYESYQLIRAMMKPLHEDKINKARAAAGK